MRKPFYWKRTGSWYAWIAGKPVRLLKAPKTVETRKEAEQLFLERIGASEPDIASSDLTLRELIGQFLEYAKVENASRTYKWYVRHCGSFGKFVGNIRVRELKKHPVTRWSIRQKEQGHSDNTRNGAIRAVMRVLNWALDNDLIEKNPIRGVKQPKCVPRDVRIAPADWQAILGHLADADPFRDFLIVLRATGARPLEVRTIEARHIVGRSWVFEVEESKGKRRRRAVSLNDTAFEITNKLAAAYPEGPLFRNRRGTAWTGFSINNRLCALAEKTGVKITGYAVRHEFISNAIERGVAPVTLAKIVGHVDQAMIFRVYAHLGAQSDHVQRAVRIATGEA